MKMKLFLTAVLSGLITFTVLSTETTYLYTFDDEITGEADSSAKDTGSPGTTDATLANYTNALWEYVTGYTCNCLKFGTDVSADAKMSISGVNWGQKFVLESKIYKGAESTGAIDLAKNSANSNFRWYIDTDGKMRLSLNGGTDFSVYTSGSVLSNSQWTRLYTVVDLSQSELYNAVKMYRYVEGAATAENYFGDGSDGNVTISADTTWDSGSSGDMMVKNINNLTINSGVTLRIYARKGCMLYVQGDLVNNGTIKVESRYSCNPSNAGVSETGLKIIRIKNGSTDTLTASDLSGCGATAIAAEAKQSAISGNGKIYTIPFTGASGASAGNGGVGSNGSTLQSGGGGGGGNATYSTGGAGVAGTCFSGGGGGGAGAYDASYPGGDAVAYGGAGGNYRDACGCYGGGGAGNPGGVNGGPNTNAGNSGTYGIGGLLILIVKGDFTNNGLVTAPGANGGASRSDIMNHSGAGGGSGGGIILALYAGANSGSGTITAPGGAGGTCSGTYAANGTPGGAGGAGSVVFEQIDSCNSSCIVRGTFQGDFASGTGAVASTDNDVDMLKRDSATFTLKTDFIKLSTDASFISYDISNLYQGNTSYIKSGSSSAIQVTPTSFIKRVTNPPSDFSSGVPGSGVTVAYDTHPTTASVFHGIFELNLNLASSSFDGMVTVDIYIKKPGDGSFKKIGEINTSKPSSGDWIVKYYWNSRAAAYEWTSTDAQAYRTDQVVRFKFQVR